MSYVYTSLLKVLTPQVEERLKALLSDIGKQKGFTVVTAEVGECDHIHCFVSAPPKLLITSMVRYLKGISGRLLFDEFPGLREKL